MSQDDGLPSSICSQCIYKCVSWFSFKQLCERTDTILRTQLNFAPAAAAEEKVDGEDITDDIEVLEEVELIEQQDSDSLTV